MRVVETGAPGAALAELKAYLRIEDAREDALLAGLLRAATETVEAMLGVLLFEREVEERGPLKDGGLTLTGEPARSLESVVLVSADGSETLVPGKLEVSRDGVGRVLVEGPGGTVKVRYRAGMGADWNWVPEVLRLAVLRAAAHFHAHRDGADDAGLPPAVRRMLAPWRARRVR
jgi:uncharacterized phiE125 gp8 family phage protein